MRVLGNTKRRSSVHAWTSVDVGAFFVANRSDLVSRARRRLGESHRAEEVAQEALLKFILAAPELGGEDHARAYLFKVIDNLCLDIYRQEGRRPNLVVLEEDLVESEPNLQDQRDLADALVQAEDAAIVRSALSMLSHAERAALVMWELEGRSTKDIAKELGMKPTSVRHTVARARASLRRILSEYVIDDIKGTTALDLLSTNYRKLAKVAQQSSRAALSFVLLLAAFLGLNGVFGGNSLKLSSIQSKATNVSATSPQQSSNLETPVRTLKQKQSNSTALSVNKVESGMRNANAKAVQSLFPGLDKNGVPVGFTIADSSGGVGALYFNGKEAVVGENGLSISSVLKTSSGAANILLNQTITQEGVDIKIDPMIAFGRQGAWIPLFTEVVNTEVGRLANGNYLLTGVFRVKSEVETTILIPASAGGKDLESSPVRVVVRTLLNPSKTQIVGEAVFVVERTSR